MCVSLFKYLNYIMSNQIHLDLPPETQPLILNAKSYISKSFSPLTSHSNLLSYLQSLSSKQFYTNIISTIFIQRFSFIHSFYSVNFPKEASLPLLTQHLSEIYTSLFVSEPADALSQYYNELKLIFLITLFITNSVHNEYSTMIVLTIREMKTQHYEQLITFLVEYVAKVPYVCGVKEEFVNMLMMCEIESDVIGKVKAIVDEQENERTKKKIKKTVEIERNKENKGIVDKDNKKMFKKVNFKLTQSDNDNRQITYTQGRGINSRLNAFTQRLQMCNVVVEKKEYNDKRNNNNNSNISNNKENKTLSIIETFMEKCAELSKTKAMHSNVNNNSNSNSNNTSGVGYKQSTKSKLRSIVNNNFYTNSNSNTNVNVGSKYLPKNIMTNYDTNDNNSLNNQYIILHNRKGRSHKTKSTNSHNKNNNKHILKRNSSDNDVVLAYKTPPKPKVYPPLNNTTSLNPTTNGITVSIAKKNYYHLLNQQIK